MQQAIRLTVTNIARSYGLPPEIVLAMCQVESAGDPWAHRTEPAYRWLWDVSRQRPYRATSSLAAQRRAPADFRSYPGISRDSEWIGQQTSWGLLQVMGAVAREYGYNQPLPGLCDPVTGLKYGCELLADLARRHLDAHGWAGVVDAYNDGNARIEHAHDYPHKVAAVSAEAAALLELPHAGEGVAP